MNIIGWSKEGLKARPATQEDIDRHNLSRVRSSYDSESGNFESKHTGEFALFGAIGEEIQAGSPQTAIDALPANLRVLYETDGRFFVGNYGVFRKLDGIETVLDSDWGSDHDDADQDGQDILPDEGTALDTMHKEQERLAECITHSYETQIEEAEELNDFTLRDILIEKCATELLNIPDDKKLMYSLNSTFCALGYNGPKEVVQTVDKSQFSAMAESAEERRQNFEALFQELGFCRKKTQIYGVPTKVPDWPMNVLEVMVYREEGVILRPKTEWVGGFLNDIRERYFKDKAIVVAWSEEARQKARFQFIKEFRASENPMHCEETLRQELYWRFDRQQKVTEAVITRTPSGHVELEKDRRVTKASKWENDRSTAFLEMFMTMGQWKAIYQLKDILIRRIDLNYTKDSDCNAALIILRDEFDAIETSQELGEYIARATKREWLYEMSVQKEYDDTIIVAGKPKIITRKKMFKKPTNIFKPSLIDRISTTDEFRWRRAVRALAKKLAPVIIINQKEK